jgi:iron complex transport system substrate-binding protein
MQKEHAMKTQPLVAIGQCCTPAARPRPTAYWQRSVRLATTLAATFILLGTSVPQAHGQTVAPERQPPIGQSSGPDTSIVMLSEPASPQLPVTVKSADGRDVTVVDTSRIVSLSGSITELIFSFGLGSQVVGRDITATFPEARALPVVTRAHDVSAESLLSLNPTLVLASVDTGPPSAIDQIRSIGVPVVTFPEPTSVDDVIPRIRAVAAALGISSSGEALVERTAASLAQARARIPAGSSPKIAFLYMRGQAGVYMIGGPKSGADSMIRAAEHPGAATAC